MQIISFSRVPASFDSFHFTNCYLFIFVSLIVCSFHWWMCERYTMTIVADARKRFIYFLNLVKRWIASPRGRRRQRREKCILGLKPAFAWQTRDDQLNANCIEECDAAETGSIRRRVFRTLVLPDQIGLFSQRIHRNHRKLSENSCCCKRFMRKAQRQLNFSKFESGQGSSNHQPSPFPSTIRNNPHRQTQQHTPTQYTNKNRYVKSFAKYSTIPV